VLVSVAGHEDGTSTPPGSLAKFVDDSHRPTPTRMLARSLRRLIPFIAVAGPLGAQTTASLGAPTPDSLARLVMARFAAVAPDAFDSVYTDPLGRDVMRSSVQQRER
jgi:hypothetical protein